MRRALDLYCGAGGATAGLAQHFDYVLGVDWEDYEESYLKAAPGKCEFVQANSLEVADLLGDFDFVWASPPCQKFALSHNLRTGHADYVPATRRLLESGGVPYVLENADRDRTGLRRDLWLCGLMVGLPLLRRHRRFELGGWTAEQPEHPKHEGRYITVAGNPGGKSKRDGQRGFGSTAEWREAMGIDWMSAARLAQAIPPAYSAYIANEFWRQQ